MTQTSKPSKKIKNKPLYILISLIKIAFFSFLLYYICDNFFSKNVGFFDSFINFFHQNFLFKSEFISGYQNSSQVCTSFLIAVALFSFNILISVYFFNEKNLKNTKDSLVDKNKKSFFVDYLEEKYNNYTITEKIFSSIKSSIFTALILGILTYPNIIQDSLNSSLITYLGIIFLSLIILTGTLDLVDKSFELERSDSVNKNPQSQIE